MNEASLTTSKNRFPFLDFIRGFAVVLMIIFHFAYDLNIFTFVNIDFLKDPFWFWFPRVIVFLFLFSVGISLNLAHRHKLKMRPYLARLAKVGLGAIAISISTYIMYPKSWIYFGTLHCIFFATIVITPFINRPYWALIAAVIIFALDLTPYAIPFPEMSHASLDYIPLFPWTAVSLLGIFTYQFNVHKLQMKQNAIIDSVQLLGRHAFWIYIMHQPILYSLVYISHLVTKS